MIRERGADKKADVIVKMDGKVLAEGANIKKALGKREILKIKIATSSKNADSGLIEIYTDAVLDSSDSKGFGEDQEESTSNAEEVQSDSILVFFESEKLNYTGEVKFNAKKTSVLEALGFLDDEPLFVIDGKLVGSKFNIRDINPNEIDRINVLKDKKAINKYGQKAKNGVVEIYLKTE